MLAGGLNAGWKAGLGRADTATSPGSTVQEDRSGEGWRAQRLGERESGLSYHEVGPAISEEPVGSARV